MQIGELGYIAERLLAEQLPTCLPSEPARIGGVTNTYTCNVRFEGGYPTAAMFERAAIDTARKDVEEMLGRIAQPARILTGSHGPLNL